MSWYLSGSNHSKKNLSPHPLGENLRKPENKRLRNMANQIFLLFYITASDVSLPQNYVFMIESSRVFSASSPKKTQINMLPLHLRFIGFKTPEYFSGSFIFISAKIIPCFRLKKCRDRPKTSSHFHFVHCYSYFWPQCQCHCITSLSS